MELLSLTSEGDLVVAKLDSYYLCLASPNKRMYDLNWDEAIIYCKSLGEQYFLPSIEELNLIHTNKDDLSLVEAIQYNTNINTLDYISERYSRNRPYYHWVWSSTEINCDNNTAWIQKFYSEGFEIEQCREYKWSGSIWTLPIRRIQFEL